MAQGNAFKGTALLMATFVLITTRSVSMANKLALAAVIIPCVCLQMWYTMEACDERRESQARTTSRRVACAMHALTTLVFCAELYWEGDGDHGVLILCCGMASITAGMIVYTNKAWTKYELNGKERGSSELPV
jgi:hypothetical protein